MSTMKILQFAIIAKLSVLSLITLSFIFNQWLLASKSEDGHGYDDAMFLSFPPENLNENHHQLYKP